MNIVNKVVINKRPYSFQHPGNREWLKLQSQMLDIKTKTLDMEKLIDYCFEHVVIPLEGNKLDLDTLPVQDLGVWQVILPQFLRGELVSGYVYPDDKQSKREGAKILEAASA
jgi:hypothetical protein